MSDEKNKYITAYGSSNADSYGRGDVTDVSTKYNMLPTNPLSDENAPEMNSYSSDGSYNQDIFGWKCFNSPVSFRNGIYGECGCVTTFSDSSYHGIKIETYDIGDNSNQSKIIIKADHIKLDGTVDDLTADKANKLVYNTSTVITAKSITSVIPVTDNVVSLGSNSNRFNKLFAKEIHSIIVHRSEQDFLPFDTRVVHIQLSIGILGADYTQHQVTISPGNEFIFSNTGYADEFGDADLGEGSPVVRSINLDSAKFMDASITPTGNVAYTDRQNNISINNYRFICISSYTSQSTDFVDISGRGRFFIHQFYIIVTRIE
jgi:hypothetical protein